MKVCIIIQIIVHNNKVNNSNNTSIQDGSISNNQNENDNEIDKGIGNVIDQLSTIL